MKIHLLVCNLSLFMIVFFFSSHFALAQNSEALPQAHITKELYIMFDENVSQNTKVFEADILELHLATIEQANRFFGFFNDASVQFETNIITQKVIITLVPNAEKQNWTIQNWASYLKRKVTTQRQQFGTYIDFTKK